MHGLVLSPGRSPMARLGLLQDAQACRLEREIEGDAQQHASQPVALVPRGLTWRIVAEQLLPASFQAWPAAFWHDTVVVASEQQPVSLLVAPQALTLVHRL